MPSVAGSKMTLPLPVAVDPVGGWLLRVAQARDEQDLPRPQDLAADLAARECRRMDVHVQVSGLQVGGLTCGQHRRAACALPDERERDDDRAVRACGRLVDVAGEGAHDRVLQLIGDPKGG